MSTNVLQPGITLAVLNPEKLLHGSEPQHRFDKAGGSVGSQGTWRLHDGKARILPVHCQVSWHEGHFCVIDHSGESFMNGSDAPLLSGTHIRLRHNDRLQIGEYQVAIRLCHESEGEGDSQQHAANDPLSQLQLKQQMCPLQVLGTPATDLLSFLGAAQAASADERDPLAYLEKAAAARVDPAIAEIFGKEVK